MGSGGQQDSHAQAPPSCPPPQMTPNTPDSSQAGREDAVSGGRCQLMHAVWEQPPVYMLMAWPAVLGGQADRHTGLG